MPTSRATLSIKLLYAADASDGTLLGAQVVGREGVDKRIDVLATALRAGMTVFDLEELELAYAPPYGSTRDPVNIAGFVAANIQRGDIQTIRWDEMASLDPEHDFVLDVRDPHEFAAGQHDCPCETLVRRDVRRQRIGNRGVQVERAVIGDDEGIGQPRSSLHGVGVGAL